MNKFAGITIVGLAGLLLGFLVWETGKKDANDEQAQLRFRHSSSWSYEDVRNCVRNGNGARIFGAFDQVSVAPGRGPPGPYGASTYVDRRGSSLVIERVAGKTDVRFKSARPISVVQKDLLEWCLSNPRLTWIPARFRSR